jgi:hypothetical protein
MANLIEVEILKFETVYKLQMMAEPPTNLDAIIYVKKSMDRGAKTYDPFNNTSPVINSLIVNLFAKLEEIVIKNPVVQQVKNDPQGIILQKEMRVFIYRLAQIYSMGMNILEEIYTNS